MTNDGDGRLSLLHARMRKGTDGQNEKTDKERKVQTKRAKD